MAIAKLRLPIPKEHSSSGRLIEDAIQRSIGEVTWSSLFLFPYIVYLNHFFFFAIFSILIIIFHVFCILYSDFFIIIIIIILLGWLFLGLKT